MGWGMTDPNRWRGDGAWIRLRMVLETRKYEHVMRGKEHRTTNGVDIAQAGSSFRRVYASFVDFLYSRGFLLNAYE